MYATTVRKRDIIETLCHLNAFRRPNVSVMQLNSWNLDPNKLEGIG